MIIKSILTICVVVICCWSQATVLAQSKCLLISSISSATSLSINQRRHNSICLRLKFEGGSLDVTNGESQCANTQVNVYDMSEKKLGELCGNKTFQSGSAFFLDLNIGTRDFLKFQLNYRPSSSSSANSICGRPAIQPSISKIVGGSKAVPHSWPWQVSLLIKNDDGGYYGCGGSLIDNKYVLTAAHCIHETSVASNVKVFEGIHYDSETDLQPRLEARRLIPHEDYNPDTFQHDIALIELNKSVTFNTKVSPVCLPTSDLRDSAGIVTGWGRINIAGTKSPTELMQVRIPLFPSNKMCGTAPVNTKQQFCGGVASTNNSEVRDSCFGDSGGPVVTRSSTSDPFVIHGVVSYGEGSTCNGNGIYARVFYYLDWITKNRKN